MVEIFHNLGLVAKEVKGGAVGGKYLTVSDRDLANKLYRQLSSLSRKQENKEKKETAEHLQERKYTQFIASATRPLRPGVNQRTPTPTDSAELENIYEQCVVEWTALKTSQDAEVSQIVSDEPAELPSDITDVEKMSLLRSRPDNNSTLRSDLESRRDFTSDVDFVRQTIDNVDKGIGGPDLATTGNAAPTGDRRRRRVVVSGTNILH